MFFFYFSLRCHRRRHLPLLKSCRHLWPSLKEQWNWIFIFFFFFSAVSLPNRKKQPRSFTRAKRMYAFHRHRMTSNTITSVWWINHFPPFFSFARSSCSCSPISYLFRSIARTFGMHLCLFHAEWVYLLNNFKEICFWRKFSRSFAFHFSRRTFLSSISFLASSVNNCCLLFVFSFSMSSIEQCLRKKSFIVDSIDIPRKLFWEIKLKCVESASENSNFHFDRREESITLAKLTATNVHKTQCWMNENRKKTAVALPFGHYV